MSVSGTSIWRAVHETRRFTPLACLVRVEPSVKTIIGRPSVVSGNRCQRRLPAGRSRGLPLRGIFAYTAMAMSSPSTRTSYVATPAAAGGRVTAPVAKSKAASCQGQTTVAP